MSSREWQIDQECKAVIGKMVDGTATESDIRQLHILSSIRARLMRPASSARRN